MAVKGTDAHRRAILRAARAGIRSRYRDPDLRLIDMAEAVGVSARQLQRLFREVGRDDFRSYLLKVRMEQAAKLVARKKNPLPLRVVARRVGYRGASGLRQAFVRFYGFTPSAIQPDAPEYLGSVVFEEDE